jgi:hypothetical protein
MLQEQFEGMGIALGDKEEPYAIAWESLEDNRDVSGHK